jgi:hypothetical protein
MHIDAWFDDLVKKLEHTELGDGHLAVLGVKQTIGVVVFLPSVQPACFVSDCVFVWAVVADLKSDFRLEVECFPFDADASCKLSVKGWCDGVLVRIDKLPWKGDVADVGEHRHGRFQRIIDKLTLMAHGAYKVMAAEGHRIHRAAVFGCTSRGAQRLERDVQV